MIRRRRINVATGAPIRMIGAHHGPCDAGLIHADKQGTSIVYSLNLTTLEEVLLGFMGRMGIAPEQKDANS